MDEVMSAVSRPDLAAGAICHSLMRRLSHDQRAAGAREYE